MSNLRSIVARLWSSPNTRNGLTALTIAGTTLGVACSQDPITGPKGPSAVAAPTAATVRDGKETIGSVFSAAHSVLSKAELDSLKQDYAAFKRSVQTGNVVASILRCEPKPAIVESKVIGPKGGSFNIGPHKFTVPAGALDSNTTIVGIAPAGTSAEVDFAPHGLTFRKPVELQISYKGCIVPALTGALGGAAGGALGVSYIDGGHIVQQMPSHDDHFTTSIIALTDHFSGYAVSWGRSGPAQ